MNTDALFSSKKMDWATPPEVFDPLNREFSFTLDVCATNDNRKCPRFIAPEQNALAADWGSDVCWMNPPYGRGLAAWVKKAYESSLAGATVVCLVPSRTEMGWWHDYAMRGEIRFVRGRIKFIGSPYNAPFPSAIVIFRPPKQ